MLLTQEQAREKWCPYAWRTIRDSDGMVFGPTTALDRPNTVCIASDCMAWRWDVSDAQLDGKAKGHCGLAGNPTP